MLAVDVEVTRPDETCSQRPDAPSEEAAARGTESQMFRNEPPLALRLAKGITSSEPPPGMLSRQDHFVCLPERTLSVGSRDSKIT